ncbi:hypothetical protein HPB47_026478 [Ixodes persulcatus]|uniref:Uncharacterized protein n=1 Tax=Ixodes persulcatus TaxID=34615 RepID=A0AC60PZV2_IXOPE|nr:hypothetical protein HPB47_026478 [Ixodes persulcatus]
MQFQGHLIDGVPVVGNAFVATSTPLSLESCMNDASKCPKGLSACHPLSPADDLIWMWAGAPPGPRHASGSAHRAAQQTGQTTTNNVGGTRSLRRMPPGLPSLAQRGGRAHRPFSRIPFSQTHAGASAPAKRTAGAKRCRASTEKTGRQKKITKNEVCKNALGNSSPPRSPIFSKKSRQSVSSPPMGRHTRSQLRDKACAFPHQTSSLVHSHGATWHGSAPLPARLAESHSDARTRRRQGRRVCRFASFTVFAARGGDPRTMTSRVGLVSAAARRERLNKPNWAPLAPRAVQQKNVPSPCPFVAGPRRLGRVEQWLCLRDDHDNKRRGQQPEDAPRIFPSRAGSDLDQLRDKACA